MIRGAGLKKLLVHKDERGKLFEILRSDEAFFRKFGQSYITVCYPKWVKGWHYHKKQFDNFCVVRGKARIVLYDNRPRSKTRGKVEVYDLSEKEPCVLRIPPFVIHGFECLSKKECWILNHPTEVYHPKKPDEFRILLSDKQVPYRPWHQRKGW